MKALITGASSGIGRDMSIYLSKLGYDVILVSRDVNKLNEVAELLNTNVKVIPLDLSVRENAFKLYDMVKGEKIDFLINNAGFGLFGNTWETDLGKELKMIDLNVYSVHILTKLFLNDMVKRDCGRILNVSSSAGFLAGPKLNTYYATKNYVTKFTMAIYEELRRAKSKVHISCLCPGPVDTNFNKVAGGSFTVKALSSEMVAKYAIDKALKNKLLIISGFNIKLGIFFNKFLSFKTSLKIIYNVQDKKSKGAK